VLGVVLMRSGKVMFVHHLALAFSLLGTGMLVGAFTDFDGDMSFGRLVLVQLVINVIAYPLVPSAAYRFLVSVNTAFLIVCWLVTSETRYSWMPVWPVALAAATGFLWAWRSAPVVLNALADAAAVSLAGTVLFDVLIDQFRRWNVFMLRPQWVSVPLAAVFIAVVASFTGGVTALRKPWMWGACLVAGSMGFSGESGMIIALLLLVISFAWDDRVLAVFAYLFLEASCSSITTLWRCRWWPSLGSWVALGSACLACGGPGPAGRRSPTAMKQSLFWIGTIVVAAACNGLIYQKEQTLIHGRQVFLQLRPVDPRSLMQGDYMRLAYSLADKFPEGTLPADGRLILKLDERGLGIEARLDDGKTEPGPQEARLRFRDRDGLRLGAESFFFRKVMPRCMKRPSLPSCAWSPVAKACSSACVGRSWKS